MSCLICLILSSYRVCFPRLVSVMPVNMSPATSPKEKVLYTLHVDILLTLDKIFLTKATFFPSFFFSLSTSLGIHWSNSYSSPIAGDTASFGWLCWLMLIDSILYFVIGSYIRMVFPGKVQLSSLILHQEVLKIYLFIYFKVYLYRDSAQNSVLSLLCRISCC